jgi:nitrogen fixation protein NifU and related proteins
MQEPQFDDLYREIILDHYRSPRNRGELLGATHWADGLNPTCGDEIRLDFIIRGGTIDDLRFSGQGCSISQSSASMLTDRLKGGTVEEAERILGKVRAMLIDGALPDDELGDLQALEGVSKLPVRVKCALLSWNVLQEGLRQTTTAA